MRGQAGGAGIGALLAFVVDALGRALDFVKSILSTVMQVNWKDAFLLTGAILILVLVYRGWNNPQYDFFHMVQKDYDSFNLQALGVTCSSNAISSFFGPLPERPAGDLIEALLNAGDWGNLLAGPICKPALVPSIFEGTDFCKGLQNSLTGSYINWGFRLIGDLFNRVFIILGCTFELAKFFLFFGSLGYVLYRFWMFATQATGFVKRR